MDREMVKALVHEHISGFEGRPSVYVRPLEKRSAGQSRYEYQYKDRLLIALQREHDEPRLDLQPGSNDER